MADKNLKEYINILDDYQRCIFEANDPKVSEWFKNRAKFLYRSFQFEYPEEAKKYLLKNFKKGGF